MVFSGIIATILGKTATLIKVQGAKDGYITPKVCLSSEMGRGFFFDHCKIASAPYAV